MQIKNKIAIITGGANGIGAALARRLVLEGAQVVIGDIDEKSGQKLINELNQKLIDNWIKTIDTNLNAVIKGTQLGIQFLKKRGGASLSGIYPAKFLPIYSASKHGVIGFTKSLCELNDTDNIRVNAVASGFVDTYLVQNLSKIMPKIAQSVEKLGLIPMDEVINAYITIIQDDKLMGDTIMIPNENNSQIISKSFVEDLKPV
ncbi:17180_t:CDS:2 [Gigaspora margarita]|uniref:17180_t:CDS:1 n=1 Tax=Gigaspora margarita TaxID=4874 RepID=A0ABN7WDW4_GIGMA|nr:17180_t:CDS:2 [Gigaspora margarita]